MSYKQVINLIKDYQKKYETERQKNGEHGSNYYKEKDLKDASSNYSAALAALFDYVAFAEIGATRESEIVKEHLSFVKENNEKIKKQKTLEIEKVSLYPKYIKPSKKQKKLIEKKDELERTLKYQKIYGEIFNFLFDCQQKRKKVIIKYTTRLRNNILKNEDKRKLDNDNWFIAYIFKELKKYYSDYNLALQEEVNRIYHGGSDVSSFVERRNNAAIMYTLLLQAIEDAEEAKNKSFGKKDSVVKEYYEKFSNDFEANVFTDSENLYSTYSKTFKQAYSLLPVSKEKLNKKIASFEKKN